MKYYHSTATDLKSPPDLETRNPATAATTLPETTLCRVEEIGRLLARIVIWREKFYEASKSSPGDSKIDPDLSFIERRADALIEEASYLRAKGIAGALVHLMLATDGIKFLFDTVAGPGGECERNDREVQVLRLIRAAFASIEAASGLNGDDFGAAYYMPCEIDPMVQLDRLLA